MQATVPGVQAESIVTDNITATLTDSAYQNTITNMTADSVIVYKNANGQWVELDPGLNTNTSVPNASVTRKQTTGRIMLSYFSMLRE